MSSSENTSASSSLDSGGAMNSRFYEAEGIIDEVSYINLFLSFNYLNYFCEKLQVFAQCGAVSTIYGERAEFRICDNLSYGGRPLNCDDLTEVV